jgi:uncharacterized membrane protein YqgA involved in biofilm formation
MAIRLPIGTFINMAAVLIGGGIGLWLGNAVTSTIQHIIFQAVGLIVLLIGIQMSLKVPEGYFLLLVFSLILGGMLGEWLQINQQLQRMGNILQDTFKIDNNYFTEGLVTAFLVYCVGSMTIVGAIEEGIYGKRTLLLIKSLLDGVGAVAFGATYGVGVLFSVVPMFFFQGGLTLLAYPLQSFFNEKIMALLSAVGGLLIIGIGINLLQLGKINVENLLPSILVAALLAWGYQQFTVNHQHTAL